MAKTKVLVVEDDEDILELVRYHLAREGLQVVCAANGQTGLTHAKEETPDLIVLDLMLPDVDGLEICRVLRAEPRTAHVPIVMLTAKGEESDVIAGLEVGADDYVTKPFSPKVLVARLRAVLRRKSRQAAAGDDAVRAGDILIDPRRHEVRVSGRAVDLTATEFGVLHFLARHPGWVFTRQQIVDAVKGEDYPVTERAVDVQMVGLRRKLGRHGDRIETVRWVGYRFAE